MRAIEEIEETIGNEDVDGEAIGNEDVDGETIGNEKKELEKLWKKISNEKKNKRKHKKKSRKPITTPVKKKNPELQILQVTPIRDSRKRVPHRTKILHQNDSIYCLIIFFGLKKKFFF